MVTGTVWDVLSSASLIVIEPVHVPEESPLGSIAMAIAPGKDAVAVPKEVPTLSQFPHDVVCAEAENEIVPGPKLETNSHRTSGTLPPG
jgi:hypothetical protein